MHFEALEDRRLLHAEGLAWSVPELTVSFAPDGTAVGEYENSLSSTFDQIASHDSWRDAVLQGLQTWAQYTNTTLSVVNDDGGKFGSVGRTQGDSRFGDIRIAAIPMPSEVLALSVPHNEVVSGTWAGDILFNSNADLQSVDEIFSLAVHEAGHVFGLGHSSDVNSPMYLHGISPVTSPTPADIAALQKLYGTQMTDAGDAGGDDDDKGDKGDKDDKDDKDDKEHGDRDERNELDQQNAGWMPAESLTLVPTDGNAMRYTASGEIVNADDTDFYQLLPLGDYAEDADVLTILVRSTTANSLIPRASVFDHEGAMIESNVLANSNGQLTIQSSNIDQRRGHFIKIESSVTEGQFAVGSYELTVILGGTEIELSQLAKGQLTTENSSRVETMRVRETSLVHATLSVDQVEGASAVATWAAIYDSDGEVVRRIAARPGETRSADTALMPQGEYRIEFQSATLDGSPLPAVTYRLSGTSISFPIGPALVDPTETPMPLCSESVTVGCLPPTGNAFNPIIVTPSPVLPPTATIGHVDPPWLDLSWWYWNSSPASGTVPSLQTIAPTVAVKMAGAQTPGTVTPASPVTVAPLPNPGNPYAVNADRALTPRSQTIAPTVAVKMAGTQTSGTVAPVNPVTVAPWRNPGNPYDVNADRALTPLDALIVINRLNAARGLDLAVGRTVDAPFFDVNGDGRVSPSDALLVVNALSRARANPEGESLQPLSQPLGSTNGSMQQLSRNAEKPALNEVPVEQQSEPGSSPLIPICGEQQAASICRAELLPMAGESSLSDLLLTDIAVDVANRIRKGTTE